MRSYDVRTAAFAVGVSTKWVDNVLSHHEIPGVERATHGVERRLPFSALVVLAVARDLSAELSIPLRRACEIASKLTASDGDAGSCPVGENMALTGDLSNLAADIERRLLEVADLAFRVPRGRPRNVDANTSSAG